MQARSLTVCTFALYPTQPSTNADREAKTLVEYKVKTGNAQLIKVYCEMAAGMRGSSGIEQFLDNAGTLVPVPKSSIHQTDSLWVPLLIANGLHAAGVGDGVEILLERVKPVRKSGGVGRAKDRPEVAEHFDSLGVSRELYAPRRVTLVDDVVTIGRTYMGCAARLEAAFPGIEVQAFALARSVRYTSIDHVLKMVRPAVSTYNVTFNAAGESWITHDGPH